MKETGAVSSKPPRYTKEPLVRVHHTSQKAANLMRTWNLAACKLHLAPRSQMTELTSPV